MSMDTPDPYLKTAKMTIRVIDGELRLFSGAPLPRLPENTIGDLIIPAHRLRDETLARWVQHEAEIELLPAGVTILSCSQSAKRPFDHEGQMRALGQTQSHIQIDRSLIRCH